MRQNLLFVFKSLLKARPLLRGFVPKFSSQPRACIAADLPRTLMAGHNKVEESSNAAAERGDLIGGDVSVPMEWVGRRGRGRATWTAASDLCGRTAATS